MMTTIGGSRYLLLPEPNDENFAGGLRPAAEAVLAKWREGHPDRAPSTDKCVEVLKLAYKHFNCPTRKRLLPAGNAVAWACTELNRFCALWITGRRDPTGTWLRLESLLEKRCEPSGTSVVNPAEVLKLTTSPLPTNQFVDVLAEGSDPLCVSESTLSPPPETSKQSPSAESNMRLETPGEPNKKIGSESGEPPLKLRVRARNNVSVI